jgi:hypothetical protein
LVSHDRVISGSGERGRSRRNHGARQQPAEDGPNVPVRDCFRPIPKIGAIDPGHDLTELTALRQAADATVFGTVAAVGEENFGHGGYLA